MFDLLCSRLQNCGRKKTCSYLILYQVVCGLITLSQKLFIKTFEIFLIMLALCLVPSEAYYAQNYADMIDLGLITSQYFKGNLSLTSLKNSALLSALSYNNVLLATCEIIMVIPCT